MVLTKQFITKLKENDIDKLKNLIDTKNESDIIFILNNLGKLPKDFNANWLAELLHHSNEKIRLLAVKNIGKLSNIKYLDILFSLSKKDENSMIRRESVSSIGRMRDETTIPKLIELLEDKDPKVSLQAIRGLLVFKNKNKVKEKLLELRDHPNEIVQEVIQKEFDTAKKNGKKKDHTNSPNFLKNVVVEGDVLNILKNVPTESVHLTFNHHLIIMLRTILFIKVIKNIYNFWHKYLRKYIELLKKDDFFY